MWKHQLERLRRGALVLPSSEGMGMIRLDGISPSPPGVFSKGNPLKMMSTQVKYSFYPKFWEVFLEVVENCQSLLIEVWMLFVQTFLRFFRFSTWTTHLLPMSVLGQGDPSQGKWLQTAGWIIEKKNRFEAIAFYWKKLHQFQQWFLWLSNLNAAWCLAHTDPPQVTCRTLWFIFISPRIIEWFNDSSLLSDKFICEICIITYKPYMGGISRGEPTRLATDCNHQAVEKS